MKEKTIKKKKFGFDNFETIMEKKIINAKITLDEENNKFTFEINYKLPKNISLNQSEKFIDDGNKILREEYSKIYHNYWCQYLDKNTIENLRPRIQLLFFNFNYNRDKESGNLKVMLPLNREFLSNLENCLNTDRYVYGKLIDIIESVTDKGNNYKEFYDKVIEFAENSDKRIKTLLNNEKIKPIHLNGYL